MTEDHALVVFDEPPLEGRAANMDAWDGYLTSYPNYIIHPYAFGVDGTQVAIVGTTTGSHLGLPDEDEMSETLVWLADVRGDKLAALDARGRHARAAAGVRPATVRAAAHPSH